MVPIYFSKTTKLECYLSLSLSWHDTKEVTSVFLCHAGSQFNYVKHRIDEIDNANFTYGYSLIEGDALTDKLEKISYEIKLVASPDGGSILKSTSKYHTKGDHEIKEEQIKAGKEKAVGLFKAVEGYLLANPDAYN